MPRLISSIIGAITVFVIVTNLVSADENAVSHYQRGINYLEHGDWSNAGKEFKEAIRIDPFYVEAHKKYQQVEYFYFEHKDLVREEYQSLVNTHPESALYHYLLALISEDDRKRVDGFSKAVSLDSTFVPAYAGLIGAYRWMRDDSAADRVIRIGLQHSPSSIDLLRYKLEIMKKRGQVDECNRMVHELVDTYPDSPQVAPAYVHLAHLTESRDERIRLLEHAYSKYDPSNLSPSMITAELFSLYADNDSAKAVQFARRVMHSSATVEDRRAPAEAWDYMYRFLLSKDTAQAVILAHEFDTSKIECPDLYARFANRLIALHRDSVLAFKYFDKALSYNTPENVFGYHSFGMTSKKTLERLSREKVAEYQGYLGKAYFAHGNYEMALQNFKLAAGKAEWAEPDVQFRLGMTYQKLGKFRDAMAAYASSLALKEDAEVRAALESLAGPESNIKVASQGQHVVDVDSAIRAAQLEKAITAPDFTLPDLHGRKYSAKELRGRIIVMDFWATWCGPCVAELPHLQKLADTLKGNKDVLFLAVSTDLRASDVSSFVDRKKITLAVVRDDRDVATYYNVGGIPTLFVIDREGKIRYKHVGFDPAMDFEAMLLKEIGLVLGRNPIGH